VAAIATSAADRLVDEILPESVEWERLVRTYPLPALLVAAVAGFLLGRSRGSTVLGALTAFAGQRVARSVHELVRDEDRD
jgi:hypothetical protein